MLHAIAGPDILHDVLHLGLVIYKHLVVDISSFGSCSVCGNSFDWVVLYLTFAFPGASITGFSETLLWMPFSFSDMVSGGAGIVSEGLRVSDNNFLSGALAKKG